MHTDRWTACVLYNGEAVGHKLFMCNSKLGVCSMYRRSSAGPEAAKTLVREWRKPPCFTGSTKKTLSVFERERQRFMVCVLG